MTFPKKTWALLDELEKLRGADRYDEDWDTLNKLTASYRELRKQNQMRKRRLNCLAGACPCCNHRSPSKAGRKDMSRRARTRRDKRAPIPEITGWLASPVDGRVRRLVDKENGDENF